MVEIASEVADEIVHVLTAPAVELHEEFNDRWQSSGGLQVVACSIVKPAAG